MSTFLAKLTCIHITSSADSTLCGTSAHAYDGDAIQILQNGNEVWKLQENFLNEEECFQSEPEDEFEMLPTGYNGVRLFVLEGIQMKSQTFPSK